MGAVVLNKRNSLVHLLWTTLMCPMSVQNSGTMYLGLAQNPSATVWLIVVFLIVFGQHWSSVAQRNKHTSGCDVCDDIVGLKNRITAALSPAFSF